MQINVVLNPEIGGIMPTKAHKADAGFDLYAPYSFDVHARGNVTVDLGVHFEIPEGYVGFLKSKSGLNVNANLICEGVIDSGYTGSIVAKMYNCGNKDYHFETGDKVTQIVFLPIPDVELNAVESLADTERGTKGFGSTGR